MDYPIIFSRHFARLVWLLVHEPTNIDEQKAALRALVTVSKDGPVLIVSRGGRLHANAQLLPDALPGVTDLCARMTGHRLAELHMTASAAAADLLGLARLLASAVDEIALDERLRAIGSTVRVATAVEAATSTPQQQQPPPDTGGIVNLSSGLDMELEIVDPAEAAAAIAEKFDPPPDNVPDRALVAGPSAEDVMASFAKLIAAAEPDAIFEKLDATGSLVHKSSMLEEISVLAERSLREGKIMLVADLLGGIVKREAALPENGEPRRLFARAVRRLVKGPVLRQIAMLLPRKRGRIEEYEAVVVRAGEEGADALIEQLTQATTAEDRRTFYNLLLRLRSGVPALVHMLGDHRWYVVRNAADLLGEMQAREGEQALIALLDHQDERVRRAAATALVRIGSSGAVKAVHEVMRGGSGPMRLVAATALAQRKDPQTAQTLVRALDQEEDDEVRFAIVAALGRVGTADAVQRLVNVAEPGGRIFNKKPTALRVAAVQGLGDARTPAAMAALMSLREDRDKDVREAVARALARG